MTATMTVFDCPHGMGKASSCVTCMEDGPIAPPRKRPVFEAEREMTAKFDSSCPGCGGEILEGNRIGLTHVGWCCNSCIRSQS